MAQHHRSGTDSTYQTSSLSLTHYGMAHTFVLIDVLCTRHSTRNEQQVGIGKVGIGKQHVGLHRHTVSRLHLNRVANAYSLHFHTASAQYVYGSQRLNILKSVGKKFVCFCHIMYVY